MKKTLLTLVGLVLAIVTMAEGMYENAMKSNIPAIYETSSPSELQEVINQLDRIGQAETERWEPHYYAAYGYIRMNFMSKTSADKDKYLELAMKEIEACMKVEGENSEIYALQGFCYMMQLAVDPANRGRTHSGMAYTAIGKALQFDPKNPRAHFLMGRMQHGTAQYMGTSFDDTCKSLKTAVYFFENGEKSTNPFAPQWGEKITKGFIKETCGVEK